MQTMHLVFQSSQLLFLCPHSKKAKSLQQYFLNVHRLVSFQRKANYHYQTWREIDDPLKDRRSEEISSTFYSCSFRTNNSAQNNTPFGYITNNFIFHFRRKFYLVKYFAIERKIMFLRRKYTGEVILYNICKPVLP